MRWLWIVGFLLGTSLLALGWMAISARQAQARFRDISARLWESTDIDDRSKRPPFYESQLAEEPEVIQRYFQWSLDDGTEIPQAAKLTFRGRIRLGRDKPWMPLRSEQVIRPGRGFIWQADVQGSMSFKGADSYVQDAGFMEWRLFGLLPVVRATGDDLTRSARWRFAAEHMLAPGALLPGKHVRWKSAQDHSAMVEVDVDGISHEVRLDFDREGMPRKVSFLRWGNFETPREQWQNIPYAVRCEGVFHKNGYTMPHQYTAYWWSNTEKEIAVVELEIEDVTFR